jgi:hypothetical protein
MKARERRKQEKPFEMTYYLDYVKRMDKKFNRKGAEGKKDSSG